jgi:dolichol-phosphate mannosyltransferase
VELVSSGARRSGNPRQERLLSIVVPVCNEEDNLPVFYTRLAAVLEGLSDWEAEVIFVDDGSRDASLQVLRALHERDPRVKVLRLSRNFGSWGALLAGIHSASGNAVMWMAADLQDPPELIPRLTRSWEEGAHVVWAVRAERHDPWPRRVMASLFYKLLRRIALPEYPPSGTDICLMDQRVARLFGQLRERNRFTQGLIMHLGFDQVVVPYTREKRERGQSKWGNLSRLVKIGIDMVVAYSLFPLRLMLYVGLLAVSLSVMATSVLLAREVMFDIAIDGWTWVALIVLLFGGLNAIMLGILGEYLWRVLDEVRERPLYIIRERVGLAADLPYEPYRCVRSP